MPYLGELHIDRGLTNISIAYTNENYIADDVAPPLPVMKRSDKYFVYNKDAFLRQSPKLLNGLAASVRRPGDEANVIDYQISNTNYYAEEMALKSFVPYEDIAIADDPLQPEIDATITTTERLKIDNEVQVATLVGTSANYNANNFTTLTTGSTGTSWAQYASANSHPFTNIVQGINAVWQGLLRIPNTLLLSTQTAYYLGDHPDYKDLYKYTSVDGMQRSGLVKQIRGLDVIVAMQVATTSPEAFNGTAATTNGVWNGSDGNPMAAIYYRDAGAGPRSTQSFRTFDAPDALTGVRGFNTRVYDWALIKGRYVEVAVTRAYKSIGVDSAGLTTGSYLVLSAVV